jgi:hypothetical protein
MKWPYAVILATGVLVGCRSTQPAANPFIRTTVPPPGTGRGAVVVQGEQYYPNGAPPVGTPAPVTGAPPIVAPPPGMAPPPGGPPPVVIPPKDKYGPPGGSFQYNQSSNDEKPAPLEAAAAAGAVQLASATEPSGESSSESASDAAERWLAEERPPEKSDAVKQAVLLAVEHDPLVGDEDRGRQSHRAPPPIVSDARVEPPESLAMADDDEPKVSSDAMRILRGSIEAADPSEVAAADDEPAPAAGSSVEPELPVKPIAQPAARHFVQAAAEPPAPGDSSATDDQVADASVKPDEEGAAPEPSEVAASRPSSEVHAERADYAFARDYGSLRGRLEYSQSSRQWKLRYIPIDGATDAFGGSVILPNSPAVESFKTGDLVAVRGSLAGKSSLPSGFSPRYELESIEPLAR